MIPHQPAPPIPIADWRAEAKKRFGPDMRKARFVCPVCKIVTTAQEWIDVKAQDAIAFSCIGRWRPNSKDAFPLTRKKGAPMSFSGSGPCNYAGGGLFQLNPVSVVYEDGTVGRYFAFDDAPAAQEALTT